MRTRHAMTLLLVLTLLTNLSQHEGGRVTATGEAERNEFTSKRRIWERLPHLRLASLDRKPTSHRNPQQHLNPTPPLEVPTAAEKQSHSLGSSLLKVLRSNHIPTTSNWDSGSQILLQRADHSSAMDEMGNLLPPAEEKTERAPLLLLPQYEHTDDIENSLLRRRHVESRSELTAKERKHQRRLERQKRREDKKKRRNKEKRRRRKENKRLQTILNDDDVTIHNYDGEEFLDCCPSKMIVVEKQVGKDRNNNAVEIRPTQQYFYERVCLPDIENKECVFPARALRKGVITKCVQQFAFVPAQVRPYLSETDWYLDFIYSKSGCSCQVSVSSKRKKKP